MEIDDEVVTKFHLAYYNAREATWLGATKWMGVMVQKCPLDMWMYQELIYSLRPDLVIETGTAEGGSAYFMAHMMDIVGTGSVISIELSKNYSPPKHPRVKYLNGSSMEKQIVEEVTEAAKGLECVMVVLDSDHGSGHVYNEMRAYGPLVTPFSYMVVEDTNIGGNPVPTGGGGPMVAVDKFLGEGRGFERDKACEKFFLTFQPKGWLKRVR